MFSAKVVYTKRIFPSSFLFVHQYSLGRPDKDLMPQQMLMGVVVGELKDTACFRGGRLYHDNESFECNMERLLTSTGFHRV